MEPIEVCGDKKLYQITAILDKRWITPSKKKYFGIIVDGKKSYITDTGVLVVFDTPNDFIANGVTKGFFRMVSRTQTKIIFVKDDLNWSIPCVKEILDRFKVVRSFELDPIHDNYQFQEIVYAHVMNATKMQGTMQKRCFDLVLSMQSKVVISICAIPGKCLYMYHAKQ